MASNAWRHLRGQVLRQWRADVRPCALCGQPFPPVEETAAGSPYSPVVDATIQPGEVVNVMDGIRVLHRHCAERERTHRLHGSQD